jgi:hypothetical protein
MDDTTLLDRVRELRAAGCTPKQVARAIGLSQARIQPLIRAVAVETSSEEPAVAACWVNGGWSKGLEVAASTGWTDPGPDQPADGLVGVLVAREHRHSRVSVCGYLVDVYCLGVKNTLGPQIMDLVELRTFAQHFFGAYEGRPLPAPIELAAALVHGGAAYAAELGFDAHPDFAATAGHLGPPPSDTPITFGRDGRPYYTQGPYDDGQRVVETLMRTVGEGNFHFLVAMPV